MRILVTRPREDAEATAEKLRRMGHEPVVAPLLEIRFRDADIAFDGVQAILATSANGVRGFARSFARRDLALFAVGRQTAEAARAAGFVNVRSADGDGAALAQAASAWARPEDGALLHAAGAETKGELAAALTARGFDVRTAILYDAVAIDALAPIGAFDAALFYSPRSAAIFARLAAGPNCKQALALCISRATAKALEGLPFRAVAVADRPNQDALLALLPKPE